MSLLQQQPKADQVYLQAYNKCSASCRLQTSKHFVRFTLLFACLIVNLTQVDVQYDDVIKCLYLNTMVSVFGLAFKLVQYVTIFKRIHTYLRIADLSGHLVFDQKTTDFSSMESCTSNQVFSANENILVSDADDNYRKITIKSTQNIVLNSIKDEYRWINSCARIFSMGSLGSLIFTIIVLIESDNIEIYTLLCLIYYTVIVGIAQIQFIFILVLVALSPLACLFCLLYYCFCKKSQGEFIHLPVKKATTIDINNVGGDCSICFQSITLNQEIYVLTCSQKHVFHCDCLRHWTKVKNTCPHCRFEIPMNNVESVPLLQEDNNGNNQ